MSERYLHVFCIPLIDFASRHPRFLFRASEGPYLICLPVSGSTLFALWHQSCENETVLKYNEGVPSELCLALQASILARNPSGPLCLATPQMNEVPTAVLTVPFFAYVALPVVVLGRGHSGSHPFIPLVPTLRPSGTRVRRAFWHDSLHGINNKGVPILHKGVESRTR